MRSLRSRVILASVLWTAGLLALIHMASLLWIHAFPSFRGTKAFGPIVFGLAAMAAGAFWVRRGLAPFGDLRAKLGAVRMGHAKSVSGVYPAEVQPLIDELNGLLADRERAVQRALATAGDLAHGLKTPLALLAREAERAEAENRADLADAITEQVDRMTRQVHYHLARARAAASGATGAAPCALAPCVAGLLRTVSKLYAERGLAFAAQIDPALEARVQHEDLEEMLGELLENACKWAKSEILIEAFPRSEFTVVAVEDDGAGIQAALRASVMERGVRADEAAPGSGLGLAIVRDLAEIYGGRVELGSSRMGGLRAELSLPSA